ncbi:MAG: 1-acyl-sn-glycerol-3-phosphate acyltransferase [Boseongicola sp.]|nr:1-acyl-sn-glycerol-3-phosphate acyltransferase [Boseongicola sp.]
MFETVELPFWLLLLVLLFAAVTASTHLLFPSVRWFFRRRAERLVARLNERLDRPIQPFKLLRRQDMIQRVIYDPEVVRAVGEYASVHGVREDVAFEKAQDYAREIVPSFSATAYFGVAIRLARWLATWLFDVRLRKIDEKALSDINPNATVVYVMNHRSNFDYVLVTYLAASQSALSYAVGEWARIWPLSRLIRAMGAYFIRRRSDDALYRKVLGSYVQKATEAGVAQAVFPEGGLSRDGKVGPSKLGILSYIVQGWQPDGREVIFVPVSLNYDRVVEDRVLVSAGRTGRRKFRGSIPEGIRFSFRYFWRRIRGRVGRFGEAAVTFGAPVSLSEVASSTKGDLVAELAEKLRSDVLATVPVVTVPLILLAMRNHSEPMTVKHIRTAIEELVDDRLNRPLAAGNEIPSEASIQDHLSVLEMRKIVAKTGDSYAIEDDELGEYYTNSLQGRFH